MPKIKVDFSKTQGFEALPAGDYPITVEETEVRQGAKAEYVNWTLKVETGEFAGRKLWMTSSLLDTAAWSLKAALQALGETDPSIVGSDVGVVEFDPDDYLGRSAIAHVSQETYKERLQNRVDSLSPSSSAASANGRTRAPAVR